MDSQKQKMGISQKVLCRDINESMEPGGVI